MGNRNLWGLIFTGNYDKILSIAYFDSWGNHPGFLKVIVSWEHVARHASPIDQIGIQNKKWGTPV